MDAGEQHGQIDVAKRLDRSRHEHFAHIALQVQAYLNSASQSISTPYPKLFLSQVFLRHGTLPPLKPHKPSNTKCLERHETVQNEPNPWRMRNNVLPQPLGNVFCNSQVCLRYLLGELLELAAMVSASKFFLEIAYSAVEVGDAVVETGY